jgi:hypothetical protein
MKLTNYRDLYYAVLCILQIFFSETCSETLAVCVIPLGLKTIFYTHIKLEVKFVALYFWALKFTFTF